MLILFCCFELGDVCVGVRLIIDIYIIRNILLLLESVFIVEFFFKCDNGVKVWYICGCVK